MMTDIPNKTIEWPTEEEERRQEIIGHNGNTGEHYHKIIQQSNKQVEMTKRYLEKNND